MGLLVLDDAVFNFFFSFAHLYVSFEKLVAYYQFMASVIDDSLATFRFSGSCYCLFDERSVRPTCDSAVNSLKLEPAQLCGYQKHCEIFSTVVLSAQLAH